MALDTATRLKARQMFLAILIFLGFLGLVLLGLYISERSFAPRRAVRDELRHDFRLPGREMDTGALWLERSEAEIQHLRDSDERLQRELEKILEHSEEERESLRRLEQNLARLESGWQARNEFEQVVEETAPAPLPAPDFELAPPLPEPVLPLPVELPSVSVATAPSTHPGGDFLTLEVNGAGPASGTPGADVRAAGTHRVAAYLPAGSFVTALLLTGLDAPTGGLARGNPLPVLLALVDNGRLPNRFRHRVSECQVTAAGHGDLASERAYLRLERLSCVLRDGLVLDLQVRGYVVGEDGKAGLRGRVVSKQGALIARSLLAGVAGGIGEGLSQSLTSVSTNALGSVESVSGDRLLEYGLARGAGGALDRIAQWYLERAEEVYPVLEVDSGRRVEIVLTEGLELGADLFARAARSDVSSAAPHDPFTRGAP